MPELTDIVEGPASFFRRITKGVSDSVSRPHTGSTRAAGAPEVAQSVSNGTSTGNTSLNNNNNSSSTSAPKYYRLEQFNNILDGENVDLTQLRKLSWNGVPPQYRTMVWQLLLEYMPTNKSRREHAISRKRKEYLDSIPMFFDVSEFDRTTQEGETLRQIQVDLPRTNADMPFFQQKEIQRAMERVLYIWSIRHPASSYVQGMNDLLCPLLLVAMHPYASDVLRCDVATLDSQILLNVEADSYWCLTKLMDNIQDRYTFSQPGLQRMVLHLEDLIRRIDIDLHRRFEAEGVQFMQFSFRWMNCLLLRELPLKAILRLWDTYLSEETGGFENFHVYVCAVLLKTFKEKLMIMDFQEILTFLQDMPTSGWGEDEVEPVLSQAYILSTLFEGSPSHLN